MTGEECALHRDGDPCGREAAYSVRFVPTFAPGEWYADACAECAWTYSGGSLFRAHVTPLPEVAICPCCDGDGFRCGCHAGAEVDGEDPATGYRWRGWRCEKHGRLVED